MTAHDALYDMGANGLFIDEEISGDGYWHLAAFTTLLLKPAAVTVTEQQMTDLAATHALRYSGWQSRSPLVRRPGSTAAETLHTTVLHPLL